MPSPVVSAQEPSRDSVRHGPQRHTLHLSLVRPLLYLGVEREVIAVEFTLVVALLCSVGPRLATLAVAGVVLLVVHPTMAWLTARDPQVTAIYLRSRRYADYYAPHALIGTVGGVPRVLPSVPRPR